MTEYTRYPCEVTGCTGHRMLSKTQRNQALKLCAKHLEEHTKRRKKNYRPPAPEELRGLKVLRSDGMPEGIEMERAAVDEFLETGAFAPGDLLQDMRNGKRLVVKQRPAPGQLFGSVYELKPEAA